MLKIFLSYHSTIVHSWISWIYETSDRSNGGQLDITFPDRDDTDHQKGEEDHHPDHHPHYQSSLAGGISWRGGSGVICLCRLW